MKKIIVAVIALSGIISSHSQGINKIWGMTQAEGPENIGTIFSTNSNGDNFQTKHIFSYINPGSDAGFKMVEYNGKFYGTTRYGGIADKGIIFEWDPATNAYTKKFEWTDPHTGFGAFPNGALSLYQGKLYGVTYLGGSNGKGVLFEWDPLTNVFTKKFDFGAVNGDGPKDALVLFNSKFYGTTGTGGVYDKGVIFEWDPATDTYTKKVDLKSSAIGTMTLFNNKFYGIKFNGDEGVNDIGEIFEWDPVSNIFIKRYDFVNTNGSYINGGYPVGELNVANGKMYGTTLHGGTYNKGVIFEWDPVSNALNKKFDFDGSNGTEATGVFFAQGGKFYGVTTRGGSVDKGLIFEWDPVSNVYNKKFEFSSPNGTGPSAFIAYGGKFYGTSAGGGSYGSGVIFEWDPTTSVYAKKIDFRANDGSLPNGKMAKKSGKFYGMTAVGGNHNGGVIFEWDPVTSIYTKKIDLNPATGSTPNNTGLVLYGDKFYGVTASGGADNAGVIFEWDPATNIYAKKFDFATLAGRNPYSNLVLNESKLYGMTNRGGTYDRGVIFEWNPATNIYTKKIDLNGADGCFPIGGLTFKDGKFYGMTAKRGTSQSGMDLQGGVIFEWDPLTNVYTKKIDLTSSTGQFPYGNLILLDGKLYGMASSGGSNGGGVIFEWDPATNVYAKKFDFAIPNADEGNLPVGTLAISDGKLYGMTKRGGTYGHGVFFEWDPATNVYTKKKDLDFNGRDYSTTLWNDLIVEEASAAKGIAGSCKTIPSIVIDNSNNNTWIPIIDEEGDAVAEIKANGNNLGMVQAQIFINNNGVREDAAGRLYLDRNLTITPQVQPTSPVDVRLYISGSEYMALKTAVNSNAEISGVNSISDLGIFKNDDGCMPSMNVAAHPVISSATPWGNGYVLSASIPSFSSFYFANKAYATLPLTLLEFKGTLINNNAQLSWKTDNEINTSRFEIERSSDSRNYSVIGTVSSVNSAGIHSYNFTDPSIGSLGAVSVYYRLKQMDIDGKFTYSPIVILSIENKNIVSIYPNPVGDRANLTITINTPERLQLRIVDVSGRIIRQQQLNLSTGSTALAVDVKGLVNGLYYLELKGNTINKQLNFLKQ